MNLPETHLVRDEDTRPGLGHLTRCGFCPSPVGTPHVPGCVCRRRTVLVRATIEYVVDVPDDWTQEQIEFHRNESSWCGTNMVSELDRLDGDDEDTVCRRVNFDYVREADAAETAEWRRLEAAATARDKARDTSDASG